MEFELNNLSNYLFWDTDKSKLDWDRNSLFIINRVLEYGQIEDWRLINKKYGLTTIVANVIKMRSLDPKALSFIALISGTPIETFRCYTTKLLSPPHWNF